MKPYIKSLKAFQSKGIDWKQKGENLIWKKSYSDYTYTPSHYHELCFDLKCDYDDDLVYVSYCIPYTYTNLLGFLKEIK